MDILSACHHDVVRAALDREAARLVDAPDVAGGDHALDAAAGSVGHVLGDRGPAADIDPAVLALGNRAALAVEHLDAHTRHGAAGGVRIFAQVLGCCDRCVGRLSGPVQVVENVAEVVHELRGEVAGNGRTGDSDTAHGREVVALLGLLGQIDQALQRDRHGDDRVHLVRLRQGKDALRVGMAQ